MKFPSFKPENPQESPKPKEKSQEELRSVLNERFLSLKPTIEEARKAYEEALKSDTFEDKEGEEEGTGEKRKEEMQKKMTSVLDRAEVMKEKLDSGETLPQYSESIEAIYTYKDPKTKKEKKETITLDIEKKLEDFLSFYKKTNIDLPPNFEETIKDIWERNQDEIKEAIEQKGFNEILVIPGNVPLLELSEKMKMGNEYFTGSNFDEGGGFEKALSENTDKPRIVLVHNTQNLEDRPELLATKNIKGKDVNLKETPTLEDYLIFQRKYFEDTQKHLDEKGWTWLATKSGARLVSSGWDPGSGVLTYACG